MSSRLGIASSKQRAASSNRWRHGARAEVAGWFRAMRGARHRRFIAYRLAAALADAIHDDVESWPKFAAWTVGVQLVRSADSIGANIAEGLGRGTLPDQRRLFLIARGSLHETEHWLERAASRELPLSGSYAPRTEELGRVLNGLLRADPNVRA